MHRGGTPRPFGLQFTAVALRRCRRRCAALGNSRRRSKYGHERLYGAGTGNRCGRAREDEPHGRHRQRHTRQGVLAARRGHRRKSLHASGRRLGFGNMYNRMVQRTARTQGPGYTARQTDTAAHNARIPRRPHAPQVAQDDSGNEQPQPLLTAAGTPRATG